MVERALGASNARGGKVTRTTLRRSSHQRRRGTAAADCRTVGRCEENDLGAVCDWWPGQLPAAVVAAAAAAAAAARSVATAESSNDRSVKPGGSPAVPKTMTFRGVRCRLTIILW